MSSANLGWLFYKDYFKGLTYTNDMEQSDFSCKKEKWTKDECLISKKIKAIIETKPIITKEDERGSTKFNGTTTYPGLLLGAGNAHELPNVKGQATLGFHFDYTTGLPVIQGSSIKGVLRSAFKHHEYIRACVEDDILDVATLEENIFNNADIFYDANIIEADSGGCILGDDYITPHKDDLKDPNPIRFIKVLPDVTFLFEFDLLDIEAFSKKQKEKLFRQILSDLGIGAKTNVGYGKVEIQDASKTPEEIKREQEAEALKKEQDKENREKKVKEAQEVKILKAKAGIESLSTCKSLSDSMKIINGALGKKAKPTPEQKETIQKFYNKSKEKKTKQIEKFFKKIIDI